MRTDHSFLDEMRKVGDAEADALVTNMFVQGREKALYAYLNLPRESVSNDSSSAEVQRFLLAPVRSPEWFDEPKLLRGQRFFRRHALDIMSLLGALSLPYCYAATPGNKAIHYTEKMRKNAGKRLLDTAHFIISVMEEGSFSGGAGPFEIQRTRVIHALVRHYVGGRSGWDLEWGTPVNQEDMAGTNLAFSFIVIRGLCESNLKISSQEIDDFLYAWRFVGYQLNIDEALLPSSYEEASHLEEAIRQRHFRPSEEGRILTNDLLTHYREAFPAIAGYFVESQIRYFTGAYVGDLLGLRPHRFRDAIVRVINSVRKTVNHYIVNPYSYDIMMRNHIKLKKRYMR